MHRFEKVKITSDGTGPGTKITAGDKSLQCTGLAIEILEPRGKAHVTLHLGPAVEIDYEGPADGIHEAVQRNSKKMRIEERLMQMKAELQKCLTMEDWLGLMTASANAHSLSAMLTMCDGDV